MGEFIEGTEIEILGKKYEVYSEQYAMSILWNNSELFVDYYNDQRKRLDNVLWLKDNNLSANMRNGVVGDFSFIIGKNMPIQINDTFDVAHELQHLICAREGYPFISLTEYGENLKIDLKYITILSNVLNDPKVNSRLSNFGFDLLSNYNKASKIQKMRRQNSKDFFEKDLNMLFEVSLYIQKVLDWELILKTTNEKHNKFIEWYDYRFPNIAKEAKQLVKDIKEFGFETPEKCEKIFKHIIKYFNQKHVMEVTYVQG
jgi:hypothetical protein